MWSRVWGRLRGDVTGVPGVVYSDRIDVAAEQRRLQQLLQPPSPTHNGMLRNILPTTEPLLQTLQLTTPAPGPEVQPYTTPEVLGTSPVLLSRVRPRQYYHPITDFALYDYDEAAPEERELHARWMARVMQFNYMVPAMALAATIMAATLLGRHYKAVMTGVVLVSVLSETTRRYVAAAVERQDLDDFLLAKEMWYIKNVETYQLGVPRLPRGTAAAASTTH